MKITIIKDDGTTEEFERFVLVGIKGEGEDKTCTECIQCNGGELLTSLTKLRYTAVENMGKSMGRSHE